MAKSILVITDFGLTECKPIKKKIINGEAFAVAMAPQKYMNLEEPLYMKRVVHIATGAKMPASRLLSTKATAKQHLQEAENFINRLAPGQLTEELSKYEVINK